MKKIIIIVLIVLVVLEILFGLPAIIKNTAHPTETEKDIVSSKINPDSGKEIPVSISFKKYIITDKSVNGKYGNRETLYMLDDKGNALSKEVGVDEYAKISIGDTIYLRSVTRYMTYWGILFEEITWIVLVAVIVCLLFVFFVFITA